jgi:hypothetical protein
VRERQGGEMGERRESLGNEVDIRISDVYTLQSAVVQGRREIDDGNAILHVIMLVVSWIKRPRSPLLALVCPVLLGKSLAGKQTNPHVGTVHNTPVHAQ